MNKPSATDNSRNPPGGTPPGLWGTTLTMTPVILTVLATIFAGMSSSEMTQSMFHRAVAAQEQSKAGDEWAFFQTKRIRGTGVETSAELLESIAHPESFSPELFNATVTQMDLLLAKSGDKKAAEALAVVRRIKTHFSSMLGDEKESAALSILCKEKPPAAVISVMPNQETRNSIDRLIEAIAQRKTEAQTSDQVRKLSTDDIYQATAIAEQNADGFDRLCAPIASVTEKIRAMLGELTLAVKPLRRKLWRGAGQSQQSYEDVNELCDDLENSFKLTTMNFDARRYRQESSFNRKIAEMFETQVRRSGVESDRHRERSRNFFYSMLAAQAGVTISSLALSKDRRNLLWLIAACAGFFALSFSGYIYFSL